MYATESFLWAAIRQFCNNDICYNPVWEILNSLFTPVWSNASPKPITIFIVRGSLKATFKVWQYQHAWWWIKMFMRLVHRSRLCQWGPASICKCITLCSLSLAVKLIKVPCRASTEGLPQFNAILHGRRWTISLTAGVTQLWQIHQSGWI